MFFCVEMTGLVGFGMSFADMRTKTPEAIKTTVKSTVATVLELFFCVGFICGGC